jgi:hypothetical protein
MTVTKTHANGGTFNLVLPVQAFFTFTRVSDGSFRLFDTLVEGQPPIILQSAEGPKPWVFDADPSLLFPPATPTSFHPGVEDAPCECRVAAPIQAPEATQRLFLAERDTDLDGLGDSRDNCPSVANPGQSNVDGDAPGICDTEGPSPPTVWLAATTADVVDNDGDGAAAALTQLPGGRRRRRRTGRCRQLPG